MGSTDVSFNDWQRRFESKLVRGSLAWKAFDRWQERVAEFQQNAKRMPSFPQLRGDPHMVDPFATPPKIYVLRKLYYWTRVVKRDNEKLPQRVLREIELLTTSVEKRVAALARHIDDVEGDDDDQWLVLELVAFWERAGALSHAAYCFVSRHHERDLDLLDQCLPLIAQLKHVVKVPEQQILALIKIALVANGHTKDLLYFEPALVRSGTARRRLSRSIAEYAQRQKQLRQLIDKLRTK
jgi:hypothetical protein